MSLVAELVLPASLKDRQEDTTHPSYPSSTALTTVLLVY
jgi:hypothetical protein